MTSIKDMLNNSLAPLVLHQSYAPPETWTPTGVVDAKSLADVRRFMDPEVKRVGPVRSGSLREFEEPTP